MDFYGYKTDERGIPLKEECQKNLFAFYYPSFEVLNGFDALWGNYEGLQDKMLRYIEHTMDRFKDNPYIIGLDAINEPVPGQVYLYNLLRLVAGFSDHDDLEPFFARVHNTLRNIGGPPMWFSAALFPDQFGFFGGHVFPAGYSGAPGAKYGTPYQAYTEHTYCCQIDQFACPSGEPSTQESWPEKCYEWHVKRIGTRKRDAEKYGIPYMVTEFGSCQNEESCSQEINQVTEISDKYLSGWAYWQYKDFNDITTCALGTDGNQGFFNEDGTPQMWKIKALSRTYLPLIQGILTHTYFNPKTADFSATFTPRMDI